MLTVFSKNSAKSKLESLYGATSTDSCAAPRKTHEQIHEYLIYVDSSAL